MKLSDWCKQHKYFSFAVLTLVSIFLLYKFGYVVGKLIYGILN